VPPIIPALANVQDHACPADGPVPVGPDNRLRPAGEVVVDYKDHRLTYVGLSSL